MCRLAQGRGLVVLLAGSLPAVVANAEPHHAVYVELFGKGGLWGLGYEYRLDVRCRIGAVVSGFDLEGERFIAFSPYLGLRLAGSGAHSWFVDLGPTAVHAWAHSPIPEWSGHSSSGVGAEVSTGYEYRARLLVRVFGQGVVGKGGALPWLGAGVGWAF